MVKIKIEVAKSGLERVSMSEETQANPSKLFVGNLPWSMSLADLESLFSEYGELRDFIIITDRVSGRSKGFGFVTFANEEDAAKAAEALNGKEVDGRALVVNVARPPVKRERRSYNDRRNY